MSSQILIESRFEEMHVESFGFIDRGAFKKSCYSVGLKLLFFKKRVKGIKAAFCSLPN